MDVDFNTHLINLTDYSDDPRDIICFLQAGSNDYDGWLGVRVSALFVILIVSSAATFFPVIAARVWVRINIYVYLFARYFGAGVIVAPAFIQYVPLLAPFLLLLPVSLCFPLILLNKSTS